VRYWTIQDRNVLDIIEKKGIYKADSRKSPFLEDYQNAILAYQWMETKLEDKVSRPRNTHGMIWFWFAQYGYHKKPNLCRDINRLDNGVCIELELDDSEVLLSDYDTWHFVLNNFYIPGAIFKQWDELEQTWFDRLKPGPTKDKAKIQSWNRCLISNSDLTNIPNHPFIQGVCWSIKEENIKKVYNTVPVRGNR